MQGFVNPFAVDITFDQCEKAISGRREFRVTVKGEYRVVNYDFCFGATFPDPNEAATEEERQLLRVRRECRGLVFDKNGALVARRLHKFFGLNQLPETSSVRLEGSCVVVEKLDGSMISAMMGPDEAVLLLSKNGPTELSSRIELAMAKNQSGWKELCIKWLKMGWTPTFEWMDPEQPVVLVYPKQELSLIAIRNISTGLYLTQTALEAEAKAFGVAVAPTLWNSAKDGPLDLDGLKERVKLAKDTEGCILKLEDQQLFVKLKSDWYFEQSKSSMKLPNKERDVWKMILEGTMDDLLPQLSVEVRGKVEKFAEQLLAVRIPEAAARLMSLKVEEIPGKNWGAAVAASKLPAIVKTLLHRRGEDPTVAAIGVLAKQCSSAKAFDAARKEFGLEDLNFL